LRDVPCRRKRRQLCTSIDDVIELTLQRAETPRQEDHADRHFDPYVRNAVGELGGSAVEECIRHVLANGYSHRTAGAAAFGEENYIWGINVGVAASTYLRELLGERTIGP
jgi:protoheme ferro-lyase